MSPSLSVTPEVVPLLLALNGDLERERRSVAFDLDIERTAGTRADDARHVLEALDGPAVDDGDTVAGLDSGFGGRHARHHLIDRRRDRAHADREVDQRIDDGGHQEVRERTGRDDRRSLPDRLVVERAGLLLGRELDRLGRRLARGILVVEELDVSAERNGGDAPMRAVAIVEAPQLASEADRERGHRHAAPAGNEEMPHLVHEHDRAQHEQEREQEPRVAHNVRQEAIDHRALILLRLTILHKRSCI